MGSLNCKECDIYLGSKDMSEIKWRVVKDIDSLRVSDHFSVICDDCSEKKEEMELMERIRGDEKRCRSCMVKFDSRNKLFIHLYENKHHIV